MPCPCPISAHFARCSGRACDNRGYQESGTGTPRPSESDTQMLSSVVSTSWMVTLAVNIEEVIPCLDSLTGRTDTGRAAVGSERIPPYRLLQSSRFDTHRPGRGRSWQSRLSSSHCGPPEGRRRLRRPRCPCEHAPATP